MMKCCFCGLLVPIMYRNEYKVWEKEGHGDKIYRVHRVYTWPDATCEGRAQ